MTNAEHHVATERDLLTRWLFEDALPLWSTTGTDWTMGGFFETIDKSGTPIEAPRRTRVAGRQIYSFATAEQLGWSGPSKKVIQHGLDFLLAHCLTEDGVVISTCTPDGTVLNGSFDLYDHAFALFGLAAAARSGMESDRLAGVAERMRNGMRAGWGHPQAGFEESQPRTLPLKANPHMHVFEASLAWAETLPPEHAQGWHELADEIATLCLDKFIDPQTGALREFFDGDWSASAGEAGRIVEPGHQFEWAWLLVRWGRMRGREDAIDAALRLIAVGEDHGVDPRRGLAISEIWDDLSIKDDTARLWQQTERIKAWLAAALVARSDDEREHALEKVAQACQGLRQFFAFPVKGGCWENIRADGSFKDEAARASSLYHIVCAIAELHRLAPA